jgi:hypothetical protein
MKKFNPYQHADEMTYVMPEKGILMKSLSLSALSKYIIAGQKIFHLQNVLTRKERRIRKLKKYIKEGLIPLLHKSWQEEQLLRQKVLSLALELQESKALKEHHVKHDLEEK